MSKFFNPRYEVRSMWEGMDRDLQRFAGTDIVWWRFDGEKTDVHDTYDMGVGRRFKDPINLHVLEAIRVEGREDQGERQRGFFTRDTLRVTVSMGVLIQHNMGDIAYDTDTYLKDRVVFERTVFTPRIVKVSGSVQDMDTVVAMNLVEVRPDELQFDTDFLGYAV